MPGRRDTPDHLDRPPAETGALPRLTTRVAVEWVIWPSA